MHNLGTVFRFEVERTLKKRSFWIMSLLFPLIIAAIFAIVFFSNQATNEASVQTAKQHFSVAVTDQSHIINPVLLRALGAQLVQSKADGIAKVQHGDLDAYFYYPADVSKQSVEVYAKDTGLFNNSRYQAVAQALLDQSVARKVDAQTKAILKNTVSFSSITYKDGHVYDGFKELIAPGVFLVLFYILITMFGNQMLTSTTEEKENRVIEMILTTIKAKTLIVGKILSLIMLAFVQIIVILIPILLLYFLIGTKLSLPNFDLKNIPFDPVRIGLGAIIFSLSFLLFTGLLVAIGAAVPTAKEASGFFGIVMLLIFGPLYAVTLFISSPSSPLVTFLSLFPLTAPIPLLLRNAVGNLPVAFACAAIAILAISAVVIMTIAIRLFRFGALEYSKRLSLKTIFQKSQKQ